MFGTRRQPAFRSWRVEGIPVAIEYSLATFEEIARQAVEGYLRFPHGGLEVGGVLFGVREGGLVRIHASRPIPCEHATGPSFVLSARDEQALKRLLENYASDPELSAMAPVGWYRSRTRRDIRLSESDLEIHQRHFSEPWQVVLVLRPEGLRALKAGFFAREADGILRLEKSRMEFVVAPPGHASEAAAGTASPVAEEEPATTTEEAPPAATEARPGRRPWLWAAAALMLLLTGAALLTRQHRPAAPRPAPPPVFSLRLEDFNGILRIQWDAGSAVVHDAASVVAEISEGGQKVELPLLAATLQLGSLPYVRRSGDVKVRLRARLAGGEVIDEVARFIARPAKEQADEQPSPPSAELNQSRGEVEQLRAEYLNQRMMADELERTHKELQAKAARQATGTTKPPAPRLVEQQPRGLPAAPATPMLQERSPVRSGAGSAVRAAEAAGDLPAPGGRSPGRLIWMGLLERNGTLTIEGDRASMGQLSGSLPGAPVRIRAYPAELGAAGLTVFSSDARHSQGSVSEPPGPRNGWNRTEFRWDPEQAAGLVVVEEASERNRWNRLRLRSTARRVPVILVEWDPIR